MAAASAPPGARPSIDGIVRRNTAAFLWFRVLFNSRFYYPIFTILFLDFGLTMEQFAQLNMWWALSIVLFEVPSGALADKFGRRRLVVFSSALMVVEMLILCLMPVNGGALTFFLFLANRIISGLAEACCSGADEALLYDALPAEGRQQAWTRVLARLMRWQSITFMLVALAGAALYSHGFMQRFIPGVTREQCMRLPLWCNLGMAVATLAVSLRFIDTHPRSVITGGMGAILRASFRQIWDAGAWILRTPAATVLILTGLLFDSFMRLFYSVGSNYYRLLGIDEAANGLILAGSSLIGIGTAVVVERLVGTLKPSQNLTMVAGLILLGLCGIALQINAWGGWAGVLFVVPFWLSMRSLHYFLSQYLHRVSDSSHRATVVSFKGLSMNLAYAAAMGLYGLQTAWLRDRTPADGLSKEQTDTLLLGLAMPLWPWVFVALCAALVVFVKLRYRKGLTKLMEEPPPATENDNHGSHG